MSVSVQNLGKRFRGGRRDRPPTLKERLLTWGHSRRSPGDFWALRHVSFEVADGEMLGIIGQNGAGKSTLLQLIGGVGRADEGRVRTQGKVGALLDLGAGFSPDLTGRENLFVMGIAAGLTRRQVAARVDRILAFAEIEQAIDNPVRTYSSGMQMRLGFAIAVHTDPQVLLVDEFLSVGDLAFQSKCLERIRALKSDGCAILLVSHSPEQIAGLCDRAIWLRQGEVVSEGPPEMVTQRYREEMRQETKRRTPQRAPERSASGAMLEMEHNRFGSLEAEILEVRLHPCGSLEPGEALRIEIGFRVDRPLPSPRFNVSISRAADGFICLDLSTGHASEQALIDNGTAVLSLQRLDLASGAYFVNVGIFRTDWRYAYDYHWHVYPLQITGGSAGEGVLAPPFAWQLEQGAPPR
ncbi:ATP-binding cassette domain-containing protein [Thiorhodococcus minor]|uniref:ABC transporter ATP-binding protein n=1 Tax=Thiorhodococcus minor TaxID=57489 RepID=A0A6M0JXD8_9GAMM|nr:ABC transporter ATP-binding protein [Thiorhodococcus minor]